MKNTRFALVSLLALALLALAPRSARAQSLDAAATLDAEEHAVLGLINDYRASRNLGPLSPVPLLNAVAHAHSADMGAQNYFAHASLDGRSPFDRLRAAGYHGGHMGENLAAGNRSAAETFEQWRRSPSHDATMLGEHYTAIGIARVRAEGSRYEYYWSSEFGDVTDGAVEAPSPVLARGTQPPAPSAPPAADDDDEADGDDEYTPRAYRAPPSAPARAPVTAPARAPAPVRVPPSGNTTVALEQQLRALLSRAGVQIRGLELPSPLRAAVSRARAARRAPPRSRARASVARSPRRAVVVVAVPRADLPTERDSLPRRVN